MALSKKSVSRKKNLVSGGRHEKTHDLAIHDRGNYSADCGKSHACFGVHGNQFIQILKCEIRYDMFQQTVGINMWLNKLGPQYLFLYCFYSNKSMINVVDINRLWKIL